MTNNEVFEVVWLGDDPVIPSTQHYKLAYKDKLVFAGTEEEAVNLLLEMIS